MNVSYERNRGESGKQTSISSTIVLMVMLIDFESTVQEYTLFYKINVNATVVSAI